MRYPAHRISLGLAAITCENFLLRSRDVTAIPKLLIIQPHSRSRAVPEWYSSGTRGVFASPGQSCPSQLSEGSLLHTRCNAPRSVLVVSASTCLTLLPPPFGTAWILPRSRIGDPLFSQAPREKEDHHHHSTVVNAWMIVRFSRC